MMGLLGLDMFSWNRTWYSGSAIPITGSFHIIGRPSLFVRMIGTSMLLIIETTGLTSSSGLFSSSRLATPEMSWVARKLCFSTLLDMLMVKTVVATTMLTPPNNR